MLPWICMEENPQSKGKGAARMTAPAKELRTTRQRHDRGQRVAAVLRRDCRVKPRLSIDLEQEAERLLRIVEAEVHRDVLLHARRARGREIRPHVHEDQVT